MFADGLCFHGQTAVRQEPATRADTCPQRKHGTLLLGIGKQGLHKAVGVNYGSPWGLERSDAGDLRLHPSHLFGSQRQQLDAILCGVCGDPGQLRPFGLAGRHDQLAADPVPHVTLLAEPQQRFPPAHAVLRLHAAGRVVDAGMHYFAVAAGGPHADCVGGLDDDHLPARTCQRPSTSETDDTGTNDEALDSFHPRRLNPARPLQGHS
mmetsp:Transcript_14377/g.45955  ORF Transcript_14377/g.45955 Transcript_14377/m.45955 type:complete len:208 (+) Transcript_14377:680-1303(+)